MNCDIQAPYHYQSSAFNFDHTGSPTSGITVRLYGNKIHNFHVGKIAPYHYWKHSVGVYFTGDANEIEFAWNEIDGGGYATSKCLHIHSSPFRSNPPDGYPQYGIHIHDNYCHDVPAAAIDINLIDPGKGTGFEIYNNIFANVGSCSGWIGDITSFSAIAFLNYADQRWAPQSGTARVFNNTFYNVGGCPTGSGGVIYIPDPPPRWNALRSGTPPNNGVPVTICSGNCGKGPWSGTLPGGPYYPNHIGISVRDTSGPAEQDVTDNGTGNLVEGQSVIGTLDYVTGSYTFTLARNPGTGAKIVAQTILGYTISWESNLIYQLSATHPYVTSGLNLLQRARLSGRHNLFYTIAGQVVPPEFTDSVGSNPDPRLINPAGADFHLQSASVARNGGVSPYPKRDFDGNLRPKQGTCDVGAYQYPPI